MKKLLTLLKILKYKLRSLFRRRSFLDIAHENGTIDDYFCHDGGFLITTINDYQKDLLYRDYLIENNVKKTFDKRLKDPKDVERKELGIVSDKVLIHLSKLYASSLKSSQMVIWSKPTYRDELVIDDLELSRHVYQCDEGSLVYQTARSLKGKRVLVISRASYLVKTQYENFSKINNGASQDFKLLALNPFSEVIISANGQYFGAYDELKVLLLKLDFDVVLFDDSLFSLPLASFAASLDKKAIVLGDELLKMFGIVKTSKELDNKSNLWKSLDIYKDEIGSDFLATGQQPVIK